MTIALQTFASGDVNYISKINADMSMIEAAINALQAAQAAGSTAGGSISMGTFLSVLFGGVTTLIGVNSYKPVGVTSNLTVAAGGAYRQSTQTVVQSVAPVVLSFAGQPSATYYVTPDPIGNPTRQTVSTDAVYSVVWTGSAFGAITRIVKALGNATEDDAARISFVLSQTFASLDARLQAIETKGAIQVPLTYLDTDVALAANSDAKVATQKATRAFVIAAIIDALAAYVISGGIGDVVGPASSVDGHLAVFSGVTGRLIKDGGAKPIRHVGCTLDGGGSVVAVGVVGQIQVDFDGTIVGWSCIADRAGLISVEVDLKRTSPPSAPPTAPPIPNTTSDKISASAPVTLNASPPAQSQAVAAAGVSTWATDVDQWDVIQFNVVSASTIQRVTLYISIQPD